MSGTWVAILTAMIHRGTCTQPVLDGALRTWNRITPAEHTDLTGLLGEHHDEPAPPPTAS